MYFAILADRHNINYSAKKTQEEFFLRRDRRPTRVQGRDTPLTDEEIGMPTKQYPQLFRQVRIYLCIYVQLLFRGRHDTIGNVNFLKPSRVHFLSGCMVY